VGNPRPVEEKKPEEKKDFLTPIQEHIASIVKSAGEDKNAAPANRYQTRDAYLGFLKRKLGTIAEEALTEATEEKTGSLGAERLKQLMPEKKAAAPNLQPLEDKWLKAQQALLDDAKAHLTVMKADAKAEIEKLFNSDPALEFKKGAWDEVFKTNIDRFKGDIKRERGALINKKAEILRNNLVLLEAEKEELNARSTEQLAALEALEKHFVKEVEKQRDTAVYEAMAKGKVKDEPFAPGVAGAARGIFLNRNQDLTLEEHAQRLRVTDLLKNITRITKEGKMLKGLISWSTEEEAEFKTKGFIPGKYAIHMETEGSAIKTANFDITKTGIELKAGGWRWWRNATKVEYCKLLLETFSEMSGKDSGILSIQKHVSLNAVEAFAKAVLERKGKPTLMLDDDSIKNLLIPTLLAGRKYKNSPIDIAKACLGLEGRDPSLPENAQYLQEKLAHVNNLAEELQQRKGASQEKKQKTEPEQKKAEPPEQKEQKVVPAAIGRPMGR